MFCLCWGHSRVSINPSISQLFVPCHKLKSIWARTRITFHWKKCFEIIILSSSIKSSISMRRKWRKSLIWLTKKYKSRSRTIIHQLRLIWVPLRFLRKWTTMDWWIETMLVSSLASLTVVTFYLFHSMRVMLIRMRARPYRITASLHRRKSSSKRWSCRSSPCWTITVLRAWKVSSNKSWLQSSKATMRSRRLRQMTSIFNLTQGKSHSHSSMTKKAITSYTTISYQKCWVTLESISLLSFRNSFQRLKWSQTCRMVGLPQS